MARVSPSATPLTCTQLPAKMMITEEEAATAGRTNPGAGASSPGRRTRTRCQTVSDNRKRAVIQLASRIPPDW